jgi:dihydroorotate dehydrogenase electron transfer subunit
MSKQIESGEALYHTARLVSVTDENYRIKTFVVDAKIKAKPGQFMMVWVPKVGERPFSLLSGSPLSFSIAKVGLVSEALHNLKAGEKISFKGPLGNGFKLGNAKRILLVGGGYGVVPLYWLAQEAMGKGVQISVIIGARNEKDIIFDEQFRKLGVDLLVATDDGSKGFKGNAVEAAKSKNIKSFDLVCSCGPEKMMYFLGKACEEAGVPSQLSMERYMKCGLGICGSCDLNGIAICREGPVLEGKKALTLTEFGKEKLDAAGTRGQL